MSSPNMTAVLNSLPSAGERGITLKNGLKLRQVNGKNLTTIFVSRWKSPPSLEEVKVVVEHVKKLHAPSVVLRTETFEQKHNQIYYRIIFPTEKMVVVFDASQEPVQEDLFNE